MDRTCVERGRFIERRDGGESEGKKRLCRLRKGMISVLMEAFDNKKDEKSELDSRAVIFQ